MQWPRWKPRSGPLVVLLGLASSGASADPADEASCPRTVQLEGAPRLVLPLAQALGQRGIASETPPGCPALVARIEERGPLVALTVIEERWRSERTVANLMTALAVIESFVRSDLSAPLLAAPTLDPLSSTTPRLPSPQTTRAAAPRFSAGFMTEAAVDTRGSAWFGAALGACTRVGPLCLGMLFRFAADLPASYKDGLIEHRYASDLYVNADLPLRLSRFTISPGIGLGAGWQQHRVRGRSGSPPPSGSMAGADNDADDYFNEAVVSDGGMRAEVQLGLSYALRAGFAIDIGLALATAFLDSPSVVLMVGKDLAEPLITTPWGMLRGGLGLRWSGP